MTAVRIRAAGPGDLSQLAELFDELDTYQAAWRVFTPRSSVRREAERRYREALDDPDAFQVVAEEDGALVGMAFGRVDAISSISDDRVLEVSNVVVVPSHRRQGIARELVAALADFAAERGAERLAVKTYAGNRAAMWFWESLGFEPRYVQMTAPLAAVPRPEGAGPTGPPGDGVPDRR